MPDSKTIISKHWVLGVLMMNSGWILRVITKTTWTPQSTLKLVISYMWTICTT